MTTQQLPPQSEPDRTMWQHGQQIDHYTANQMRAYALAALSTRPVSESIHEANAKTLQALVDELREMLGVKEGESLKEAVQQLAERPVQMSEVDLQDDDALRFAQRVLESSDAPESDRKAARDMLVAIRSRVRKANMRNPA